MTLSCRAPLLRSWPVALLVSCSIVNAPDGPGGSGGAAGSAPSCEPPYETLTDCGECGVPCAPANVTGATCATGACRYGNCTGTFQSCDNDMANGCESDRLADPDNCGACGQNCAALLHVAEVVCTTGQCDYATCAAGWADCDNNRGNGCETEATTVESCGGCNLPCQPGNATGPVCQGGVCGYGACVAPYLDCDGDTANGCETDGSSSQDYCGSCSTPCTLPATCIGGSCISALPSCNDILLTGASTGDGLYPIDPNGGDPTDAFTTFCDMSTDSGGWTLVLNRVVNSDNLGQPAIGTPHGAFDDGRGTNWNFDVNLFWQGATQAVFAAKENDNCAGCPISSYDSAIRMDLPAALGWSVSCPGTSSVVNVLKLVGLSAGQSGTAYSCAAALGWGSCGGNVCHYGVHSTSASADGSWSSNGWNELHFPSQSSTYAAWGDVNGTEGNAYCRSCAGGLTPTYNLSSTCCQEATYNAKSRWTIWLR
jgi:hypothetical protein